MATAAQKTKAHKVMSEFKHGSLRSSSGGKVTGRDQAVAIAMSEAGMSRKAKQRARLKRRLTSRKKK